MKEKSKRGERSAEVERADADSGAFVLAGLAVLTVEFSRYLAGPRAFHHQPFHPGFKLLLESGGQLVHGADPEQSGSPADHPRKEWGRFARLLQNFRRNCAAAI